MEYFQVLLPLAIILVISKIFGKICVRIGIPQVIGLIAAGILVSVVEYIPGPMQDFFASGSPALTGLGFFAKIGVVLIMFNAGLDINVKQIKSVGLPATIITLAGVFVPMILGFIAACLIRNGTMIGLTHDQYFTNLFYGVIMTATSVSVTVATLQELGKLTSKVGTTVVTAAILDDIVGIIVLSVVIGMSGKEDGEAESPWIVLLKTVLFFIAAVFVGWLARKIFAAVERKFPHHRLLPVMSVALCFFFAYAAEKVFGVADITGAFVAGMVLSSNPEANYIERRSEIMGYMMFTPVFFANIAIANKFSLPDMNMLIFGLVFVVVALLGKVIGCGGTALLCKYSKKDSFRVGIGMMARAEVALVCAQKGVDAGLIHADIMPFILLLIVVSSLVTPILLKASYKEDKKKIDMAAAAVLAENAAKKKEN